MRAGRGVTQIRISYEDGRCHPNSRDSIHIWEGRMTGVCQRLPSISLFLDFSKLGPNSHHIGVTIFATHNPVILNLFTRPCIHHHCLIPEHVHPWGFICTRPSLLHVPTHTGYFISGAAKQTPEGGGWNHQLQILKPLSP